MIWEFQKWQWEEMDAVAKRLGYSDIEELFTDVTLGKLQKNGLDPMKWI